MTHALIHLRFSALATCLLLAACSTENGSNNGSGGSSGSGGSGGSTGGRGGAGGTSSMGTGGATGGSGGATGGSGGSGGATAGSGGATGGTGGSGGATGGTGGTPGTGGSTGGTGGSPTDGARPDTSGSDTNAAGGIELAGKLHKYLRSIPCDRPNPQDTRRSCLYAEANRVKHDMLPFGGDPAVTYDVTIRVRGNVEPRGYTGGMLQDPMNLWFYVGGMPGGPDDNALYNQYKILISQPQQAYYLNANSKGVLPRSSKDHDTWKIDYTAKLKVKGGATVDVVNEDRPSGMNANYLNVKVEGVPPELLNQEPDGFKGQFFYIEVVSVVPAP